MFIFNEFISLKFIDIGSLVRVKLMPYVNRGLNADQSALKFIN